MVLLRALWGRVWPYITVVAAAFAAFFGIRQSGISVGREKVRREQADATSEQRRKINEADNELVQMDRSAIRGELRKWVRPVREDEDR